MKNKRLLILIILAIFFIGVTLTSVSANDVDSNLTETEGEQILEQTTEETPIMIDNQDEVSNLSIDENSDKISGTSDEYQIKINTKDYTNCDNPNKITMYVGQQKGSMFYVSTSASVDYTVSDINENIVYTEHSSSSFKSNYDVFRMLPDGIYICKLNAPSYKGATIEWVVYVDTVSNFAVKGKDFMILTKDYQKYNSPEKIAVVPKGTLSSYYIFYKVFDTNHNLKYEYSEFDLKQDVPFYLKSNYEIFKNLPNGNYLCVLTTTNSLDYQYFVDNAELTWKVIKTTPKTTQSTSSKYNPQAKYIKVGKYKVPVRPGDSLNTQKNKVIKYLKSHVKKAHKFKIHGYKFKVSAKMYRKILYYKKYGYDGKMGYANFKVKTNKYKTYKAPIYETYKITKKVWVYKKVLSGWARWGDDWYDDEYYSLTNYFKEGWISYGSYSDEWSDGVDHYIKLKKKVKKTITKNKIVGYEKVKLKVYAYGVQSKFKVGVQFWGLKNGKKYRPITNYYMF